MLFKTLHTTHCRNRRVMVGYGKVHVQLSDMFHLRMLNKIFIKEIKSLLFFSFFPSPQKKLKTARGKEKKAFFNFLFTLHNTEITSVRVINICNCQGNVQYIQKLQAHISCSSALHKQKVGERKRGWGTGNKGLKIKVTGRDRRLRFLITENTSCAWMCSLFYGGGGESTHAGLAGDRTAFASKIRFTKRGKKPTPNLCPNFPSRNG